MRGVNWCSLTLVFKMALHAVGAMAQPQADGKVHPSRIEAPLPAGPILLLRTPVAPFTASGSATFLSGFGSTNPAILSLDLRGFMPGHYQVGIVRESDPEFIPLAKFSIVDPTAGPDRDTALNTKTTTNGRQSEQLVSHNVMLLARLADPRDVAKLVVADNLGNYLLAGDFRAPKPKLGAR